MLNVLAEKGIRSLDDLNTYKQKIVSLAENNKLTDKQLENEFEFIFNAKKNFNKNKNSNNSKQNGCDKTMDNPSHSSSSDMSHTSSCLEITLKEIEEGISSTKTPSGTPSSTNSKEKTSKDSKENSGSNSEQTTPAPYSDNHIYIEELERNLKYEKGKDIDFVLKPAIFPRSVLSKIHKRNDSGKMVYTSKNMILALLVLCIFANKNGEVSNTTTQEMAEYLGYKYDKNLRKGLKAVAKVGDIKIEKGRPRSYKIIDYGFKKEDGYKAGVVIPTSEITGDRVKNINLKSLRLKLLYLIYNHHSPLPENKKKVKNLMFSTLKEKINADSHQEVEKIMDQLEKNMFFSSYTETNRDGSKVFTRAETEEMDYRQGTNKVKVSFNYDFLGIMQDAQSIKTRFENLIQEIRERFENEDTYDFTSIIKDIEELFENLEIEHKVSNYCEAMDMIRSERYSFYELSVIKYHSQDDRWTSKYSSVNYLRKLLQLHRRGSILQ